MSEQRQNNNNINFPIFNPIHSDHQDHEINNHDYKTGNGNRSEPNNSGNGNSVRVSVSSDDDDDSGSDVNIVQAHEESIS